MSDDDQTPADDASVDIGFDEESENTAAPATDGAQPMNLDEIDGADINANVMEKAYAVGEPMASDVAAIYDIPVQISAVLGRSTMQVSQLLKLGRGAVVELDRKVGEAIDIYVNNRLVARGEVVVVEDKLGVTMTEIVKSDRA